MNLPELAYSLATVWILVLYLWIKLAHSKVVKILESSHNKKLAPYIDQYTQKFLAISLSALALVLFMIIYMCLQHDENTSTSFLLYLGAISFFGFSIFRPIIGIVLNLKLQAKLKLFKIAHPEETPILDEALKLLKNKKYIFQRYKSTLES